MKPKRIIVNGDDFGYSAGVNAGILEAYTKGILTSTTVLANLIGDNDELIKLPTPQISKPPLGIGVHLNITSGHPLSAEWPHRAFERPHKDSGLPEEWQGSAWTKFIGGFTAEQFRAEYTAQVEKALAVFGAVDHLDSHISHASYPPAESVYLDIAEHYALGVRPLAPLTEEPKYGGDMRVDPAFYAKAQARHLRTVDAADLTYQTQSTFYDALERIKPGETVEFMFHPANDDSKGEWRMTDLALLTSPETLALIDKLNIQLVTYSDL